MPDCGHVPDYETEAFRLGKSKELYVFPELMMKSMVVKDVREYSVDGNEGVWLNDRTYLGSSNRIECMEKDGDKRIYHFKRPATFRNISLVYDGRPDHVPKICDRN
jgi:hypothetical protein